nr:hypothetical protein [Streptomyces abyssalis]
MLTSPDYGADGGSGNDTLIGTDESDTLSGGSGRNSVHQS